MPHDPSYAERKVEGIFNFVRSPTNKLYVLFLNYTVHVYDEVLRNLQCEDPKIHVLRRSLHKLLRNILVRFVKPSAMFGKCVDEVQYSVRYNQKANNELVIGEACQNFIASRSQNYLQDKRVEEFYSNVRLYFMKACNYLMEKLPLNDPLLQHAEVADILKQQESKSSDLMYFLERFPGLIPLGS